MTDPAPGRPAEAPGPVRLRVAATIAFAATAVMGAIAVAALPTVNADARAIVLGATVVGVAAGVAAGVLLLRGARRMPAALLVVSALTPTYFAAAVNLVPMILAIVLVVSSFDPDRRRHGIAERPLVRPAS